ncbi:MAG: choice-of-anchor D domain-containing protein [Bacteroidota bacterium]
MDKLKYIFTITLFFLLNHTISSTVFTTPEISVSGTTTTDFGNVPIGTSATLTYTIQNTGTATLVVSMISTDNSSFTVSPQSLNIPVGNSALFSVTFSPVVSGSQTARVTILSNDADEGTITFDVEGTSCVGGSTQWGTLGSAMGFSGTGVVNLDLQIAPDGTPYVAYSDVNGNNANTTVKRYDGTNWVDVGSPLGGQQYFQSLGFRANGNPVVSYSDFTPFPSNVVVKEYNGSTWQTLGASFGTNAQNTSLAVASNNTPYVAHANGSNSAVRRYDGSNWNLVGSAFGGVANSHSLALATDDTPYVAYSSIVGFVGTTEVRRFDGVNWVVVGGSTFGAEAYNQSLALSPTDEPYVAYQDFGNGSIITVQRYNGVTWEMVGSSFGGTNSNFPSLAFAPDGSLYVAYLDGNSGGRTVVRQFDGTNWVQVGNSSIGGTNSNYQNLALDNTGKLYVAHTDGGNSQRVVTFTEQTTFEPAIALLGNITSDFGTVPVGTSLTRTYTIINTGCALLTITGVSSDNAGVFSVQNVPSSVAVGASVTFELVFMPTLTGLQTATITISSDASNQPSLTFGVSGTAFTPVTITASVTQTCPSTAATLTANAGDSYLWSTGQTMQSISVSPTVPTTYSVTVTTGGVPSFASTTIQAEDTENPNVITQNVTVDLDGSGNVSITAVEVDAGSTDNCGIASFSLDQNSFTCSNIGANTVTLTVTDINGNSATATAIITVVDNNEPEVSVVASPAQIIEDSDNITFVFTFTRTSVGCLSDLTVNFTVGGDATYNDDYYLVRGADTFTTMNGTVMITSGQTSAQIVLQAQQDAIEEMDETIILTVDNP